MMKSLGLQLKIALLSFMAFALFMALVPQDNHKFYVSTTTLDYRPQNQQIQITMQLFIDDVQAVLNQRYDASLRLAPDNETDRIVAYLEKYIRQKFVLATPEQELEYAILGKEYRNDLVLMYLELPMESLPDRLIIKNQILFDLFDEQKNILHFKNGAYRKSILLTTANPQEQILTTSN